nr:reverse transcriptase domain-containing protein [Tanacetum cinerariifolium]
MEKLLQQEQWAYLSSHPSKCLTSFCYDDDDDDEDYTSAITPDEPVLSTEEPDNSLSIWDEHLDTIPAIESVEFIKSGVENLIPIPSESEGIPEHMCDVPSHDNSPPLDSSKNQIKDFSESNKEFCSIDDDSFSIDDIDYVEASPLDSELISSEVMKIVTPEIGGIDDDILLTIKDDILREKLLNVNLLIAKIEALNANPTPSSDCQTKSSSTSLNSLLEETNNFDNSLLEFETFCFGVKEINSGSITTHPGISLLEYEAFYEDHVKEISSGSPTTHSDSSLYASFIFDLSINPFPPADRSDSYEFTDELIPFISPPKYDCFLFKVEPNSRDFTKDVVEDISPIKEPQVLNTFPTHPTLQLNMKLQPSSESLFTYVVWIFLPFLVYSVAPHCLFSVRNEDIIFDLGICKSTFSRPDISYRCGTVKTFNTHRSHLNKCPMIIHGQNNPPLDVLLFHFIPFDSLKYGGIWSSSSTLNKRFATGDRALLTGLVTLIRQARRNLAPRGWIPEILRGVEKKYVKDPVEIHNIKQRDGETIEDFMERFKIETGRMKGAPECMRISRFMHGVNNPELTKRLNEHVPKTIEEMMITTTAFIRGEAAAASKKRVMHLENHKTNPKYTPQIKGPTSEKVTQSFEMVREIAFPQLTASNGTERPLVIEAEMGGHPSDMTRVPRSISEHRLNIREGYTPVRQKKRGQAPERARAIQAEVQKLVDARIMRGVYYHDWLSNPVMVESLCGYPFKCFLDAYKGYHQIQLAEADEEKTDFHTGRGVYCYTKMLFGLKNAGATYQRMMDKAFESQVGQNIEVYVDDLVVKSHTEAETVRDIEETFRTLRKVNMKLNPKKCSFGLAEGVFLGYVITPEGIKPCPDKTAAVLQLPSPQTVKERGPDDGKGNNSNADLLHKPGVTGSGAKLFDNGEIGNDSPRRGGAAAKVEHYAGRAQYYIQKEDVAQEEPWTLFTDSSSCVDGSGAGLILTNPEGVEFTYALRFQFTASNNEAEYEVLVAGLRITTQMGVKNIQVNVDSKLVANQVLGTYVAKEDNMIKYLEIVRGLVSRFTTFSISQVPRSKNKQTDALSKIASNSFAHLSKQIADYLKEGVLPGDNKEARKLCLKARQYELMKEVLYRRSFLTPWLRCVGPLQADYIIREIHEGSCSMHAGPRSVVAKSIRLGYYWPTMHKDARDMIQKCNDCPFPKGPGKVMFLIVAMDYFTKWVEAKAVETITGGQVKKFVWDNIVCRFGIPGEIISDNGKQFADNPFKDWCDKLNITQRFASVKHPQSNRLVEKANRSLREGIKARLGKGNKKWVEELPYVLWAHRTMIKSSHGDTPFSLTYGTEAVIPAEIGMPTYRTAAVDVVNNDKELRLNLNLLEERRERAVVCEARAKSKMIKYYNARVRGVAFKPVILFTAAMTPVTQ